MLILFLEYTGLLSLNPLGKIPYNLIIFRL